MPGLSLGTAGSAAACGAVFAFGLVRGVGLATELSLGPAPPSVAYEAVFTVAAPSGRAPPSEGYGLNMDLPERTGVGSGSGATTGTSPPQSGAAAGGAAATVGAVKTGTGVRVPVMPGAAGTTG